MGMFVYQVAYRHIDNDAVEGFAGYGFTREKARDDAISQIKRKLEIIVDWNDGDHIGFIPQRVIEDPFTLTKDEQATIRCDWKSNKRY
jgi:hypothetical protein